MAANYPNNLEVHIAANQVCKAFGIKITSNGQVVALARNAGFDSLFIDMEHAWLSQEQVNNLCQVGLLAGVTPFVRVPHQCGNGFVQRVLDGGAMGIIFPHIHSSGPYIRDCFPAASSLFALCLVRSLANLE
jgi:2-keto-3-deoxy-L-rhamnonate aldolase RhmA